MDLELSKEQKELQLKAKRFVEEILPPYVKEWEKEYHPQFNNELNLELRRKGIEAGIANIFVPKEFGGQGLGQLEWAIAHIELLKSSNTLLPTLASGGYGPFKILYEGSDYLKEKYLWPTLRGEKISSFGFTEPMAGSDLRGIQSTAVKQGNNYVLNGRKIFPSFALFADYTYVAVYTDKEKGYRGMSIFIIDNGTPGWKVVRQIPTLSRHWPMEAEMKMENCVVPAEQMVAAEGEGFAVGMAQFNQARLLESTMALGMAEKSLELAIAYAKKRKTFGKAIGGFQAISWPIVESWIDCNTMRLLIYQTAWKWDHGMDTRLDIATTKAHCIDKGIEVISRCMQILGGRGLSYTDYPIADFFTMLRHCKIMEGSSEIMRIICARELLGRAVVGP